MDEPVQPGSMPRHRQLRQNYENQRYLRTAPWGLVEERMRDILVNLVVITENKRTGLPTVNSEAEDWMLRFTQADAERALRFGPYPAGLRDGFLRGTPIPRSTHALAQKAVEALRNFGLPTAPYLAKFGRREYMQEALAEGSVLVSPATRYNDSSLNPAIRDDELAVTIHAVPEVPALPSLPANVATAARATTQFVKGVRAQAMTNYYVYCMCTILAPRLFVDFNYDACLVINDPTKFEARLLSAMLAKAPKWTVLRGSVIYVDPFLGPLTSPSTPIGPHLHKHFRYAYQKEYRLTWIPPVPTWELEPIKVELGSLNDCCQLIELT